MKMQITADKCCVLAFGLLLFRNTHTTSYCDSHSNSNTVESLNRVSTQHLIQFFRFSCHSTRHKHTLARSLTHSHLVVRSFVSSPCLFCLKSAAVTQSTSTSGQRCAHALTCYAVQRSNDTGNLFTLYTTSRSSGARFQQCA